MRVGITGIGMINALGNTTGSIWTNLIQGRTGIAYHDLSQEIKIGGMPTFDKSFSNYHGDLPLHLAFSAATEAIISSKADPSDLNLIVDTCVSNSGILSHHTASLSKSLGIYSSNDSKISPLGSLDAVCSSILKIASGVCEKVLLVGTNEATMPYYLNKILPLGLLNSRSNGTPRESIKSFDIDARGMVLGEGAAAILFESFESAGKRSAEILAEVKGYSRNNDGKYLLRPEEEADGIFRACKLSINKAEAEIGAVLADGMGLPERDYVEAIGIGRAVKNPKVTSAKAYWGHLFGASGATQFASGVLAIMNEKIFPVLNLEKPAHIPGISYIKKTEKLFDDLLVTATAFGGGNFSIVLGKGK